MANIKPIPVETFISYSRRDERLKKQLLMHLGALRRKNLIDTWHFRMIGPGKEWEGEIDQHLKNAAIILLLISPDFINSDYCFEIELKQAMKRHRSGKARVIPIILKPCLWEDAIFGMLQALPRDAKPVSSWKDKDEAFKEITNGVRRAIKEITTLKTISQDKNDLAIKTTIPKARRLVKTATIPPVKKSPVKISVSGAWTLSDDQIYQTSHVNELDDGNIEINIKPRNAEEEAVLRDLKSRANSYR